MRLIAILLIVSVAMMALKFAVIIVAIVLAVAVLFGTFTHPAQTLGTLTFFVFADAMATHAVACLSFLGVLALCLAMRPIARPPAGD